MEFRDDECVCATLEGREETEVRLYVVGRGIIGVVCERRDEYNRSGVDAATIDRDARMARK